MPLNLLYTAGETRRLFETEPLVVPLRRAADGLICVYAMIVEGPAAVVGGEAGLVSGFTALRTALSSSGGDAVAIALGYRVMSGGEPEYLFGPAVAARPNVRAAAAVAVLSGPSPLRPLLDIGTLGSGASGSATAPGLTVSEASLIVAAGWQAAPADADVTLTPGGAVAGIDSWGGALLGRTPPGAPAAALLLRRVAAGAVADMAVPLPSASAPWWAQMAAIRLAAGA